MQYEELKGKRVLLTGGCGFIGRNLTVELKRHGAEVKIFDINGVEGDYGDIRDERQVIDALRDVDFVYHLGAIVGVDEALQSPALVMDVNLGGTANLLKALKTATNVKRMVFASSSEIYGDREMMKETDTPAPCSVYGLAKATAESYCWSYWHDFGIETVCLRFFNVYGRWQKQSFVVPIFKENIRKDERPLIIGDGKQYRCYTHINDAVDGLLRAMLVKEALGEIFNIGSETETSVLDLAMFMIKESGKDIKPMFRPQFRDYEIMKRHPDITKARVILGWEPKVDWQTGVRELMNDSSN